MKQSLLVTLASNMGIHASQIHPPIKTSAEFPDLGLRKVLLGEDARFDEDLPPMDPHSAKAQVWMVRDSFRCHYFIGNTPERDQVWIVGPYVSEDMGLAEIRRRCEKLGLKNPDLQFLRQYYYTLPHIRDENLMYIIVQNHCLESFGADGFELAYWEMSFTHAPRGVENPSPRPEYQRDALEFVYAQEKLAMECVSQGNYPGAVSAIHRLESKGLEPRTNSTLRDMKNFGIVFNTLCRVAARNGGVHPVELDRYSRTVSIQIENASSLRELAGIRESILKEYCALVRSANRPLFSPLVQQMVDYIQACFSQRPSLMKIAADLNLSPGRLSVRFRQETGKPFSEYLTDVRMAHARQLLAETDLPIAAVAAECGIPDNNYFSRLFRLKEKATPREYRALHKK